MNWVYGITTVASRGNNLLPKTVESLAKAGFDNPVLFVDGMDPKWQPPSETLRGIVFHEPAVGHVANWVTGLVHLYATYPKGDFYAMFEDDLLCVSNLKEYLENCPYPEKGYWNLITHPENTLLTQGREGWHLSNQMGRGAVGLVFNRETAGKLIREMGFTERTKYAMLPCADGMVIDSLKPLGFKEYIHFPTLLQHTGGGQSTMGHPYGEMAGFPGEQFNPCDILTKRGLTVVNQTETKEQSTIRRMVMPNQPRPSVWFGGVIQIHVTRACDLACCNCTQNSNLGGKPNMISLEGFELACKSLSKYWGVVGMFGGNPAVHPKFEELCDIFAKYVPWERRGLWCNNPKGKGKKMAETFNPGVSNLNVHLNQAAYDEFKRDWPASMPCGLERDSEHAPVLTAMIDLVPEEDRRFELMANCDINRFWSAMVCEIPNRGVRGYFCEIAGGQALLHAHDPDWPDLGIPVNDGDDPPWWDRSTNEFAKQLFHCHRCGVPLKRKGQLAVGDNKEQVSQTHLDVCKPKVRDREVELVQIDTGPKVGRVTEYLQNAGR